MRLARVLPPRRRHFWKVIPACTLAFVGWGCAQPPYCFYYGYGAPPCAPVMAPAPTSGGTVCEPPVQSIGSTMPSDAGNTSSNVASSRSSARVVVSEPVNPRRWRGSDSDATLATTTVEGGVSDSTVK